MRPLTLFSFLLLFLASAATLAETDQARALPSFGGQSMGDGLEAGDELLDPEVAFAVRANARDGATLVIDYEIADGYYLYRDKFAFSTDTAGVQLGRPVIPPGKIKQDEFFGEMEVHRNRVSIELPITTLGAGTGQIELIAKSQGCADIGVCYPPLSQKILVDAPAPSASNSSLADTALSALTQLGESLGAGAGEDELLDPEEAYVLSVATPNGEEIEASWQIAEGYYLYKDKMAFELRGAEGLSLGEPQLSEAKQKEDEFFGRIEAYYGHAEARLPVRGVRQPTQATLQVTYQGCADMGVCYPPITKQLPVSLAGLSPISSAAAAPSTGPYPDGTAITEQDRFAQMMAAGDTWLMILSFFGVGLLLTFTPCVLPMIPIISSIVVGHGGSITGRRAFHLSLVYVLAMAATYTLVGVLVGLSGESVQAMFQNPWVLSVFAGVFVLLALSMFGFYELQMPAFVQSRLTSMSNNQKGGTFSGAAVMGFLSALIVGPCVTAPLVGALIFIAQTGDALTGGLALFALSMGMGVPLLVVGTSAGKFLPKAGRWMDAVKAVFGVLLLGLAIWLLERILPLAVTMALWAVLLVTSAIYMGALEPVKEGVSGWFQLWKGLGLVALLAGTLLLIGAAGGGTSLLYPLKGLAFSGTGAAPTEHLTFQSIKGLDGLNRAVATASAQNKTVMLDFYADWCISCKEMEAFTFSDEGVQAALANTLLLQTDVTANDEQDKALLKHFGLFGPPAILFFTPDGNEQRNFRVVGFMAADSFRRQIESALAVQQARGPADRGDQPT